MRCSVKPLRHCGPHFSLRHKRGERGRQRGRTVFDMAKRTMLSMLHRLFSRAHGFARRVHSDVFHALCRTQFDPVSDGGIAKCVADGWRERRQRHHPYDESRQNGTEFADDAYAKHRRIVSAGWVVGTAAINLCNEAKFPLAVYGVSRDVLRSNHCPTELLGL